MKRCDKVGGEMRHSRGKWLTYQEFPKVFDPFFSASRSSCAALNYGENHVSAFMCMCSKNRPYAV